VKASVRLLFERKQAVRKERIESARVRESNNDGRDVFLFIS